MARQLEPREFILPNASHPEDETRQFLDALSQWEQRIVRMRFGIDSEVYAVKEVAKVL